MSPYISAPSPRFRQGDIFRDVTVFTWAEVIDGDLVTTEDAFPYCVALTQECDLEQDFNNFTNPEKLAKSGDKLLPSILFCPAFPADKLKAGQHIPEVTMQVFGSSDWKRVVSNNNYRYHFLPENPIAQLPDVVLDFKRYFTVPRKFAYRPTFKECWRASLGDLFREHLSSRFAHYLSRVGLPDLDTAA